MAKVKNHKPPIALWESSPENEYVTRDGKLFICKFDRIFTDPGIKSSVKQLERFMIDKTSYQKQLDQITHYVNFFINMYDPENELLTAYFRIKSVVDKDNWFKIPTIPYDQTDNDAMLEWKEERDKVIDEFISFVMETLFSEDNHIAEHIKQLTLDNYLDDIESGNDRAKKNDKVYLESLEFTNKHVRIMLSISFAMKMISPIMFHYFYMNQVKLEKTSDFIFRFYKPLFEIFGDGVNMFNKIYVYVKSRVLESHSINQMMFEKREIFGIDKQNVIDLFVKKVIISENMVKYTFPSNWSEKTQKYVENPIGFNKTIIKFQLGYFIKEVYDKNLTEVSNIKNSEGLSGSDKMEMNIRKLDEGKAILATMNASITTRKIMERFDIPVTMEEVEYMKDHWKIANTQKKLIQSFVAKFYGNFRDTQLLTRNDFCMLALIIKKKLLIDSGYDISDPVGKMAVLPYILTGNMWGKATSRIVRSNKYFSKLEQDLYYTELCKSQYSMLLRLNNHEDEIKNILMSIVNSRFTYVTPENPDLLNKDIVFNEDKVGSELLAFLFSL
jgi:hypothetical protein